MPALANITVKKADGTTDVTYTAVAGASGDNSPAVFSNNTIGTVKAERPTLLVGARDNGPKTARRVDVNFSWPIPSTDAGGNKVISGRMTGTASVLVPQNQDVLVIAEQAAQFGNLIGSALVRACFNEGYAPRS